MSLERVLTFEAESGRIRPAGRHASLAEASASLPEGAYTTLRTYGGRRVLRLDLHLGRLEESVALQGRAGRIDGVLARSALRAALEAAAHPESRLRLTFAPPRLFVSAEAFAGPAARLYQEGVACTTLRVRRENPHAKDTRFIPVAQQEYGRLPPGIEEGLIVDADDAAVLEGLSSNFFAVLDGTLRTERERALAGVTRSAVLEVAAALMPVEPRAIRLGELPHAAEAFITSVSRGVLPVVRIDARPVGDGRVGQRTRAIQEGFAALVEREAEPP